MILKEAIILIQSLRMNIHHFDRPNLSMTSVNLSNGLLTISQLLNAASITQRSCEGCVKWQNGNGQLVTTVH